MTATLYFNKKLNWTFRGNQDLIEKLRKAMSLQDINSKNTVMVFRKKNDIHKIPEKYFDIKTGWRLQDNLFNRYLTHEISKDIVISLKPDEDYMGLRYLMFPIWYEVIEEGGLPLHSALIERSGKGILFLAPNSGGKSTISRLSPWSVRSDDLNIVLPGYLAYPLPTWSYFLHKKNQSDRRVWETPKSSTLSAIFFLEKSQENQIEKLPFFDAVSVILESVKELCFHDFKYMDLREKRKLYTNILDNSISLVKQLPFHLLRFNKENGEKIWKKIEEVIDNA